MTALSQILRWANCQTVLDDLSDEVVTLASGDMLQSHAIVYSGHTDTVVSGHTDTAASIT